MIIKALIQAGTRTRRAVSLPVSGRFVDYHIADDNEPARQVGETVSVSYVDGDQYATIVQTRSTIRTENPQNGTHYWQYDAAEQSDMPEGFIRAWPIGGGFAKGIPEGDVKDWDAKLPETYEFRTVGFEGEPFCKAWINPHYKWNGWEIPYVEREELLKYLAHQDALATSQPEAGYMTGKLQEDGMLVMTDPNYDDGPFTIEPEHILVPDAEGRRQVMVWNISNGCTWETIDAATIGDTFARLLAKEIGEANMAEVRRLNAAESDPDICHSHDFCDANMVMLGAFKEHGFKEPGPADDCTLWNEAWSYAKATHLGGRPYVIR